jgi:hypothetical protein
MNGVTNHDYLCKITLCVDECCYRTPTTMENKSLFRSVVAFQIAFHAEIHANDVFLFFKNYF